LASVNNVIMVDIWEKPRALAVVIGTHDEVDPYLFEARQKFETTPLGELR